MKFKRILASTILALTLPLLATTAQAHPGRTDGNGGHTDSETGYYHYHHGYPAHDHYDMDGDGDIDCPYDFDDQTGSSSGESSSHDSDSDVTPHISASLSRQITQTIRSVKFVLRQLSFEITVKIKTYSKLTLNHFKLL